MDIDGASLAVSGMQSIDIDARLRLTTNASVFSALRRQYRTSANALTEAREEAKIREDEAGNLFKEIQVKKRKLKKMIAKNQINKEQRDAHEATIAENTKRLQGLVDGTVQVQPNRKIVALQAENRVLNHQNQMSRYFLSQMNPTGQNFVVNATVQDDAGTKEIAQTVRLARLASKRHWYDILPGFNGGNIVGNDGGSAGGLYAGQNALTGGGATSAVVPDAGYQGMNAFAN